MNWFSQKGPKKPPIIDGRGERPPGPRPGPASRTIVTVRDVEDLRGLTSRVAVLEQALADTVGILSRVLGMVEAAGLSFDPEWQEISQAEIKNMADICGRLGKTPRRHREESRA